MGTMSLIDYGHYFPKCLYSISDTVKILYRLLETRLQMKELKLIDNMYVLFIVLIL